MDEGIELLTGIRAGDRESNGEFTVESINRRVEDRLIHFSVQLKNFAKFLDLIKFTVWL